MQLTDLYTDEEIDRAVDNYLEANWQSNDWVDPGTFDFSWWPLEEQIDFMKEWA